MGFSPIGVGDASGIHNTFTFDGGGIFSLAGVLNTALSMHFMDTSNGDVRVGTGTWNVTNAQNGKADYYPSPADVQTPGLFKIYPVLALPSGPKAFDSQILEILALT